MDPKAFKVLLRRAVLLPLLTVATLAAVLLWAAYDSHRSMQMVDHSDRVISSSRLLLKLQIDMETGLRGYLITGDPAFLEPYENAQQKIEPDFRALHELIADSPKQQARLAALQEDFAHWQQYAERMIELRRSGGAYNEVAANLEGKRRMDAIRDQVTDFQDVEDQLRDQRIHTAQFRWRLVVAGCVVVAIGAGFVIGFLTFVEMRDLAASFQRSLDSSRARAAELARSKERWATTLASIGDAVMATDAEGKITFVNPVAESLLEMSAEECVGRSQEEVFKLANEESGAVVESPVAKAIRQNRTIELGNSVVLLGNKGARTPIADSAAPIRDSSGQMTGVVLVFRDVTERRNRERERDEALEREQVQRVLAEDTASRLRKIEQVTEATLAHLPLATMMELLLRRAAAALQADMAQILLLNRQTQMLEVRTSLGLEGAKGQIPVGEGVSEIIAQTGQLRIVEHLGPADLKDRELREHPASLMGAPLLVEDRVIGVLLVHSKMPRRFTGDEASLLQLVADRIALAIESKQAEEALRKSKELLEDFIREAPVALAMFDRNMRYLQYSQRWLRDTCWQNGSLLGYTHYEAFPDMPAHWKDLHRRGLAGESLKGEEDWLAADGKRHTIQWEIHPWGDDGTESGGIIISLADLTERKLAEDALRASEERWETTLQSIGDAVISTDAAGRIIFMNEVAQKLTGWTLAEAQGAELSTVFNIVQEVTRIRPENPVSRVLRLGKVVGLANHTLLVRRDGTEIPIEDSGAPIRDRQNRIEGVVLVFHDVSEQRQIEKAFRESDRLATTGRLAATIAHEIHNPLDTVGNLLFLVQQSTQEAETRNFAALASEELRRVTQMTQQMLTFQRESAKPTLVKIQDVLDNVLALFERKIQSAGITIAAEIDSQLGIRALPGELRQTFANLVGNSIEAIAPRQGQLKLRAYSAKGWRCGRNGLRVVVADNGPGIPSEIRKRIFDPFFTTKGESGTGLGLWIATGIVEKYGGTLRVRSTTKEGSSGTCFSVFFPVGNGVE
jgi:PAS domain S-box-containing protein